jgi:cellulose synthase/poly-beta-1,6-N-acetylglucosamine synthase-like glycosyltransferase
LTAGVPARVNGQACHVLSASAGPPEALRLQILALRTRGMAVALAPRSMIEAALERKGRQVRIEHAVRGLLRERPAISARSRAAPWQPAAIALLIGLAVGGFIVLPDATLAATATVMAAPFLCVTLLRLAALRETVAGGARASRRGRDATRLADWQLPVYSVLVPLFREARVLPGLIAALRALDYPPAKLDILLVVEEIDIEMQASLLSLDLPPTFRTVVVPKHEPQTKPKALNYALQFARGDFVVVYDAEDRPEPDQLRRALDLFRRAPPKLGCLQARLNIYNPGQSWLTRQFTIEYSVLFDAILPALERLKLPVPLGGTSNHFPRATLIQAGAWDPFNVTEDADLGIRLSRLALQTRALDSTTWEEAPPGLGGWLKQRTRWLKGWMQTYIVHTRFPRRLNAELGLRAAFGLHVLMGGLVASALVHPLFYALLAYHWWTGQLFLPAESTTGALVWAVAWINLGLGYLVSIALGMVSVIRRRRFGLALHALAMPVYWLLISVAAYRAVWQLMRDPYLWEKTEHGMGGA